MMSVRIGRYMEERDTPRGDRGVYTTRGARLGTIEWNKAWRCWEFLPNPGTAFTEDCLRALADHLVATRMVRRDLWDDARAAEEESNG